ncbi:outer membrane murein-binding lipoprotein Lpp [Actinoplanes lobatus]|uniref:Outer membrane murein-binding lipoprotein Lpp n=1 Tax=Actinoplanes lobatus TaxID=113568 RepID=A0A7W7HJW0_9ACTN|nr:outer membrane murein-binding lipoprotein Lpp [Actinoplanes lobatus]
MFTRLGPMTAVALAACLLGGCTENRHVLRLR